MGISIAILLSSLLVFLILRSLAELVHQLWWNPLRIQRLMARQGINGPPYSFLHGSTKETMKMRSEARSTPMDDLSHDILPKVQPHIDKWISTYGRNYLSWFGTQAQLVITEPELIKEVLINREQTFPKPEARGYGKKILGDGLVSTKDGVKWAKQRRLANHTFHGESLKNMVPAMVESVRMMLEKWKQREGKETEVFEEFKLLTSEVISRTAFGSSYIEGRNIFEMLTNLGLLASRNALHMRFPGMSKIWKTADEIEAEKLEKGDKKVMAGEADDYGNDFLGQLVKAYHDKDESKKITVDGLVDECKTFYFAGHETITAMLTWVTFLLASHPDWQEEARKEVLDVFRNDDPDPDGIAKLRTMSMIMNEALRLYPPVIGFTRKVDQQLRLGKLVLPPGIQVFIANLKLQHDPEIWGEDVHLFRPERFSEGVSKATNNNAVVFLPFGFGPRMCVGMNFAMNEAKIVLSMILQHYTFKLSPGYIHSPVQLLLTRPQHGLQVIFHPL
ncbi:hypothetical protein NL676_032232 [Syzygium grande]|nr:hypothetical protein NL676_032232 [Syzygium grande]